MELLSIRNESDDENGGLVLKKKTMEIEVENSKSPEKEMKKPKRIKINVKYI